jgi:hypothetical protein
MKWAVYIILGLSGILLWSMAGVIGKYVGKTVVQEYQQGKNAGLVNEAQAVAAKQIRKQLPMKIDEITTLQSVASMNSLLIYNYSIDLKKSEIDSTVFLPRMKKNLKSNVCGQKAMAKVIKYGGRYMYSYVGVDGILIGDFKIGKKECGFN